MTGAVTTLNGRHFAVVVFFAWAALFLHGESDNQPPSTMGALGSVDLQSLRQRHVERPPRPYEPFVAPRGSARDILTTGWVFRGHPPLELTPPIDWQGASTTDRSWNFAINAWRPLNTLLAAHSTSGEARHLDAAVTYALHWIESNPRPAGGVGRGGEPFQWYDMAVGRRAYRLAYMVDVLRRDPSVSDERLGRLWTSLVEHLDYLDDDDNIAFHTNHGFFQTVGQLAVATRFEWLPGMPGVRRQASERLQRFASTQFSSEGVHKEHSPAYHLRMLENWWAISEDPSLVPGEWVGEATRRFEDALAWMVMPNQLLAPLGDTARQPVALARGSGRSAALEFVLSAGTRGQRPGAELAPFVDAGLVVIRDWPSAEEDFAAASYLAQQCAFHSRTHKHADDLTFVWYDQGQDILIGSGFYGYLGRTEEGSALHEQGFWYSDPRRVFVESTASHNTVEIDGQSYDRKHRRPFGSAIEHWGTAGDAHFAECRVSHAGGVEHVRLLVNRLHHWLVVLDVLVADEAHAYRQWFHFAPDLQVSRADPSRVTITGLSVPLMALSLVSGPTWSEPVKGQNEPLQGWWSPAAGTMEPNVAVALEQRRAGTAVFATLFAFDSTVAPDLGFSRVTDDGRSLRLRWQQAGETQTITVERPPGAKTTLRYDAGR